MIFPGPRRRIINSWIQWTNGKGSGEGHDIPAVRQTSKAVTFRWRRIGELAFVAWMLLVAVLFFLQFTSGFDTALDIIRRTILFS